LANKAGKSWRLATIEEEAKGIDGYIGTQSVQVKSGTYRVETHLSEVIETPIIYYEKKKDGIEIFWDDRLTI
jgi:hypothetical protein